MSNPRITKFGTVSESPDGTLLLNDFVIDCDENRESLGASALRALIARLQDELDKVLSCDSTYTYGGSSDSAP